MFDEEAVAGRWVLRLLKLAVVAGAAILAGWWLMQLRGSRGPTKRSPAQQIAVVRNRSEKPLARRIAAERLEDADASIVNQLTGELSSGDAVGRELAAFALGRLEVQDDGAVDALIAALDDPEQTVRRQAAVALGRLGARPEEVAAELVQRLHAADPETRGATFKALRRLGREGTPALLGLLADSDADIRRRAVIELGRVGGGKSEFFDALRGRLRDPDARVRAETHAALWQCSAMHLDELIAALHDADPLVQSTACALLARMGADAEPAVPELVKLVASNGAFAWTVERTLLSIDKEHPQISTLLAPLLDSEDKQTAEWAARMFLGFGRVTEAARQRLLAHVDDPRGYVAAYVIKALRRTGLEGRLQPPELIDALEEAGDDDDVVSLLLQDDPTLNDRIHGMPFYYPRNQHGYGVADRDLARLGGLHNLRLLDLSANPIGDAGLQQIAGLEKLEWLLLYDTKVTSAGLAHLTTLTKLRSLALGGCAISDEGLDHLQKLPALEALDLRKTQVTDAGMAGLAGLAQLKAIWLDETQVTDAGLAHLAELRSLEDVGYLAKHFTLRGLTQLKGLVTIRPPPESVADDDLALLADMPRLRTLILSRSGVTDAGLAHISKLTQLESLWLNETAITDAGLARLGSLSNLKTLYLDKTRTTEPGKEALQKALPNLQSRLVQGKMQPLNRNESYQVVGLKEQEESDAAPSLP
jgi:HEAT repeat protein